MTRRQIDAVTVVEFCKIRFRHLPRYLENEKGNCRKQYATDFAKWWAIHFFSDWTPRREKLFVAVVASQLRADCLLD